MNAEQRRLHKLDIREQTYELMAKWLQSNREAGCLTFYQDRHPDLTNEDIEIIDGLICDEIARMYGIADKAKGDRING